MLSFFPCMIKLRVLDWRIIPDGTGNSRLPALLLVFHWDFRNARIPCIRSAFCRPFTCSTHPPPSSQLKTFIAELPHFSQYRQLRSFLVFGRVLHYSSSQLGLLLNKKECLRVGSTQGKLAAQVFAKNECNLGLEQETDCFHGNSIIGGFVLFFQSLDNIVTF